MNIQLIEDYYRYFNERHWPKFLALLDPKVQHDISNGKTEIGRDKFALFMDRMNEHYQEQVSDLVIFSSSHPERLAAEFTVTGQYLKAEAGFPPATGQSYCLPVGAFFEVNDTHIKRVTNYYNYQHWLAQVQT